MPNCFILGPAIFTTHLSVETNIIVFHKFCLRCQMNVVQWSSRWSPKMQGTIFLFLFLLKNNYVYMKKKLPNHSICLSNAQKHSLLFTETQCLLSDEKSSEAFTCTHFRICSVYTTKPNTILNSIQLNSCGNNHWMGLIEKHPNVQLYICTCNLPCSCFLDVTQPCVCYIVTLLYITV